MLNVFLDNNLIKNLAKKHNNQIYKKHINLRVINKSAKKLLCSFKIFDKAALHNETIAPSAQWLIDNYYILDKSFQSIKTSLDNKFTKKLNAVLELCETFLAQHQYKFQSKDFYSFIKTYQTYRYITIDELWALPICLKIILLQKAVDIAVDLSERRHMRDLANKILTILPQNNQVKFLKKYNKYLASKHFTINFYYQLRAKQKNIEALNWIEQARPDLNQLSDIAEQAQTNNSLCMANIVTSIKHIDDLNWNKWLEQISQVDIYLNENSEYSSLDTSSRNLLRKKIVNLAKYSKYNELAIAHKAIDLLTNEKCKHNLGFYLVGKGERQLKNHCEYKSSILEKLQKFICKYNIAFMLIILCSVALIFELFMFKCINNILVCISILPIAFEVGFTVFNKICGKILPNNILLGYDFTEYIPQKHSTLVAIPCLLANNKIIDNLINNLEINYLVSAKGNLFFALIADFTDSTTSYNIQHKKLLDYAQKSIDTLNLRFNQNEHKFFLFTRNLIFNKNENCYMGWERKRGKLEELNKFLRGDKTTSFLPPAETIKHNIKYIITLDSDTILAPNSAAKLIGKLSYPLNKAKFCIKTKKWLSGYNILQPRITTLNSTLENSSLFQAIFSRNKGCDPYIFGISDSYQDLFGEGTYIGKAIYDIDNFMECTKDKIKENLVLSHDLLEGSYAKCAFMSDIELLEEYPSNYLSEISRLKRWVRGDWQLLPYIFSLKKQLNILSIIKMLDNLRRPLVPIACIFYLIWSAYNLPYNSALYTELTNILAIFSVSIVSYVSVVLNFNKNIFFSSYIYDIIRLTINLVIDFIIKLTFICHSAFYNSCSIWLAIYRQFISKKYLLQWQSYQLNNSKKLNFFNFLDEFKYSTIFALLILSSLALEIISYNVILYFCSILWLLAVFIAYFLSKYNKLYDINKLSKSQKIEFLEFGTRIWHFYENFCNTENNFLPIDNFQEYEIDKIAHRTSPTNIGMYLLSNIAAYDFGWIDIKKALINIENCFTSLKKMQKHNGHFYNWYNTKTLEPLTPYSVSTVDSGNLAGHLITLAGALSQWNLSNHVYSEKIHNLQNEANNFAYNMQFDFLLDKERELLSIGYDITSQKLMSGAYDMLASEARLAYFFAIAKGDIKVKIWQKLGRFLTCLNGQAALLSWSGSMFEYLMPPLILREHPKSLLGQTNKLIINKQIKYGKANKKPWGISEAAFNAFDPDLNYQYSNFGVPDLGLQRSLAQNYVVSPYASLMAAQTKPKSALKNLRKLVAIGAYGKYGFYDAIDFTSKRLPGKAFEIIKNYYAHHHGMSLVAIYNLLKNNKMQDYFYSDAKVQAFELLLQEKTLPRVPFSNFKIINKRKNSTIFTADNARIIENKYTKIPQALLLNSGNIKFIINNNAELATGLIHPICLINNFKIGGNNNKVTFNNNKALFEQFQNELYSSLDFITTTPTEYNFYSTGYGCKVSITNNSTQEQFVNIKFLIDNITSIKHSDENFVFNSNNETLLFPIQELSYGTEKTENGYKLLCHINLPAKQTIFLHYWYLIDANKPNITYLSQNKSFENALQKSWLNDQTKLFYNSITLKEAADYQTLLSLLLYNKQYKIQFCINNNNYLYSLRDLLNAVKFWQNRAFDCELNIINNAHSEKFEELEAEINWLKQTYNNILYVSEAKNNKDFFILHAQNGDISEQLIFLKLGNNNGTS